MILASKSPRRAELLKSANIEFQVIALDIDETIKDGEDPFTYTNRVALEKGRVVAEKHPNEIVISADTTVALFDCNWVILGKPSTKEEAYYYLKLLSGREHIVITSVAVRRGEVVFSKSVPSHVIFRELSDQEIENYISTGDCFDKAGGYGIQGKALSFVSNVRGSLSGVIGLPIVETLELVKKIDGVS